MPPPVLRGFEQKVIVGIADLAVSNNQGMILSTYSLGSCIGISIFDPVARVGGLLHVMLPDSSIEPNKAASQPAMFMDTGIPALFRAAYELGAEKYRMVICAAGGAQVLDASGFFNIGRRNYEIMTQQLHQQSSRIQGEQIGGVVSRSMFLNLATGEVRLKISGQQNEMVLCKSLTNT